MYNLQNENEKHSRHFNYQNAAEKKNIAIQLGIVFFQFILKAYT